MYVISAASVSFDTDVPLLPPCLQGKCYSQNDKSVVFLGRVRMEVGWKFCDWELVSWMLAEKNKSRSFRERCCDTDKNFPLREGPEESIENNNDDVSGSSLH